LRRIVRRAALWGFHFLAADEQRLMHAEAVADQRDGVLHRPAMVGLSEIDGGLVGES
jgi:hypothetical protein